MTLAGYVHDAYKGEFEAQVVSVTDGKFVVLDQTYFYPVGGGQPHDMGTLETIDGREVEVVFVGKFNGSISHQVQPEGVLKEGDTVRATVYWERRHKLMRMHTGAHVVSAVVAGKTGAKITGNQLDLEKSRIDYELDNYDPEFLKQLEHEVNKEIQKNHVVTSEVVSREKAEDELSGGLSSLKIGLPEHITEVRLVTIGDIDRQACGGTHVKETREIGKLTFTKFANKGKNNRRVYFDIE